MKARGLRDVRAAGLLLVAVALLRGAPAAAQMPAIPAPTIPLLAGQPDPHDTAVTGYLFKPAGSGPFPAVVLIHGCDGYDWNVRGRPGWTLFRRYAERYVADGFVALVLDSFAPRGVSNVCARPMLVSPARRAWDAFSAAHYLASLSYVDARRLVLQGDSHGGWTTLVAMQQNRWHVPDSFAAAIAFYPYCFPNHGFTAAVLILIGGADDWTPPGLCRAMVQNPLDDDVELHVFPGATHAFDFPGGPRTNALGHFMTYDPGATTESWRLIEAFLRAHLTPPASGSR